MFTAQVVVLLLLIAALGVECFLSWRSLEMIHRNQSADACGQACGSAEYACGDTGLAQTAASKERLRLQLLEESILHLRRAAGSS
jgi:hypothetical protein